MNTLTNALNLTAARARQAAAREPVWATWTYDAATWQRYDTWAWQRVQRRSGGLIVLGLVWALLWTGFGQTLHTFPLAIFIALAPLWIVGATLVWAGIVYRRGWQLHQARRYGAAVIQIGPLAVNEPGGSLPLNGGHGTVGLDPFSPPMHTLRAVQLEEQPLSLLRFQGWGGRFWPTTVYVPVPLGQEAAAAILIQRFRQEILDQGSEGPV